MTIKDVAKKAGVAPSTVSRILNAKGKPFASPAVRQRVWEAVRALGYTTNQQAKNLRLGTAAPVHSGTIHILFARSQSSLDDFFFKELATHVQAECLKQGFAIGQLLTARQAEAFEEKGPAFPKTDGLVILGRTSKKTEGFTSPFKKRVVHITLNQMETPADHIMCDGVEATRKALAHLYEKGHRHIAYLGEYPNEIRYHSFQEFMQEKKLPLPRQNVIYAPMTIEGGLDAAVKIAENRERPTAVFCANDSTAIGLLKGLARLGVQVPQDLSVIAIDNIPQAGDAKPALTTVQIPLEELGAFAVKTLADRLRKGHTITLRVFMPTDLIIRESVGPPPKD